MIAQQTMSTKRFVTDIFFWEHEPWAKAYMAAILEDSRIELPRQIATAEAEIGARLALLLGQRRSLVRTLELDALDDALSDLSLLMELDPA